MTEESYQRAAMGSQSAIDPEEVEKLKKAPDGIKLPAIAFSQTVLSPKLSVPEINPISNDRQDKRAAAELRRELQGMAASTAKVGLAMQSAQMVIAHAVNTVDQGQEEMMKTLYSRKRHEGMNELVSGVISQGLQQLAAQSMAFVEQHFKRLMERL